MTLEHYKMALEDNKRLAREFLEAMVASDVARLRELMTDDATVWIIPSTPFSGLHQKEEFLSLLPKARALAESPNTPPTPRLDEFTAEEDRVSVTGKITNVKLKDGKVYAADFHLLFFIRDGKVAKMKEYKDTAYVA